MERTLRFNIEIDKDGNYKIVSDEPESGTVYLVAAGNTNEDTSEAKKEIGNEVMGWILLWEDELDSCEDYDEEAL